MEVRVSLTIEPIETDALWQEVARANCGALNLFLGVTRDHHQGKAVTGLEYHAYPEMAEKELFRVASETAAEFGIEHMVVVHRLGRVAIGEASLAVAASSPHRHQALEGTHEFINRLKKDVPIWKRESFADGTLGWVEGQDIQPI